MAYVRYIRRNGKIYGPYVYRSIRDKNGKVRNLYVGRKEEKAGLFSRINPRNIFSMPKRDTSARFIPLFLITVFAVALLISGASAASFDRLTIQGQLRDSSNEILSGKYNFSFNIYSQLSGGASLYEKNFTNLTVDTNGLYTATLTGVDLPFDADYYVGINVNSDGEMSPRMNMTDAGTAFRSNRSEYLGSYQASYFLNTSAETQTTGGSFVVSDRLNVTNNLTVGTNGLVVDIGTGRVGIGTMSPEVVLDVRGEARIGDGTNYARIDSDGDLSLVGTADYLVAGNRYAFRYSADEDYGLYFDLSNVEYAFRTSDASKVFSIGADTGNTYIEGSAGIGTTNPTYKLEVSAADLALNVSNFLFANSTAVGIGASNPEAELHVNGSFLQTAGNPEFAGNFSNSTYLFTTFSVYVSGRYAYVTSENLDGLTVIDVSNPVSPTYVGNYSDSTYLDGPDSVYVSGKYAYV
ncbi:MAG: hypothetical protein JW789_02690, partial [Candidatus Aenigmarchaeota archaeon]|nr:hypothetical protein [Candidatus Aenigmarchaeota archaeon]